MNNRNFERAMDLFSALIVGEEVSKKAGKNAELYDAYTSNAEVNEIVDTMLKKLGLKLYDSNESLFVSAGDHNRVFGFSNEELKRMMGLRLNKELYLCYYIIYNVMTMFYHTSASYTYLEYVKTEDVIEAVSASLKNVTDQINLLARNELEESSFELLAITWDEQPVLGKEDAASRASRGSKAGYVKTAFNFLISQNLFAEAEERYYPTERFHDMMRHYFEEERGRLFEMEQELMRRGEEEDAAY